MLEHDDAGKAVTFPPPLVVSPPPSLFPPPPQPAAANASAAKRPTSATAFKPCLTLPPPSPFAPSSVFDRGSIRTAQATCKREQRGIRFVPSNPAPRAKRRLCSYRGARAEVAELAYARDSKSGARKGVWVRFPPSAPDGRTESGSLRPARPSERQRGGQHAEAAVSEPDERITALPAVLAAPYSTVGAS